MPWYEASKEYPRILNGVNQEHETATMFEEGYELLGYSSFNAAEASDFHIRKQAKLVKASVVYRYSQYTNTESGVMPLSLPDTQTSYTNFSGSAYGSGGGYANYYGTAQTTQYGTKTTYVPYSVDRYNYFATFWAKMKPPLLGVRVQDLSKEQRSSLGTNKGVQVFAVIKSSPAYSADILNGDILRKISERDVVDAPTFSTLIGEFAGKEVTIEVFRNGKTLKKRVRLNDPNRMPAAVSEKSLR